MFFSSVICPLCPRQRDIVYGLRIVQFHFRVSHADKIVVAVFLVDPERGLEIHRRIQGADGVLDDCIRIDAQLRGLGAVDVHFDFGMVVALMNAHVLRTFDLTDNVAHLDRQFAGFMQIVAGHLNVERRGQTEIQRCSHDAAGIENKLHTGKLLFQFSP